jgi:cation transport regulator ChaC
VPGADDPVSYFAYGSNMQRATFVGRRGMQPRSSRPGRLDGFDLRFDLPVGPGERGVANLAVAPGAVVHGVLYSISTAEASILDRTEGVDRGLYERLAVRVITEEGSEDAFTYLSRHREERRKPSARYLGLLLEGAREHGLPVGYLERLAAWPLAVDEREPR